MCIFCLIIIKKTSGSHYCCNENILFRDYKSRWKNSIINFVMIKQDVNKKKADFEYQ